MNAKGDSKEPVTRQVADQEWPKNKLALLWLLVLTGYIVTRDVFPLWFRVVFGGVLGVGSLIVGVRHFKDLKRREHLRRQGWCSCGYDLRGCPAKETSQHWFDVWGRMSSTKKIVVCPECGKKQVLWEHE